MTTKPGAKPITYEAGRDFASNAGRLSVREVMKANPAMARQIKLLARALDTANEGAAEAAGLGKEYRAAMKEYRQAMQLREKGKAMLKSGAKYVPLALGWGLGAKLATKYLVGE